MQNLLVATSKELKAKRVVTRNSLIWIIKKQTETFKVPVLTKIYL